MQSLSLLLLLSALARASHCRPWTRGGTGTGTGGRSVAISALPFSAAPGGSPLGVRWESPLLAGVAPSRDGRTLFGFSGETNVAMTNIVGVSAETGGFLWSSPYVVYWLQVVVAGGGAAGLAPVTAQQEIVVGSGIDEGRREVLAAFSAANGTLLWDASNCISGSIAGLAASEDGTTIFVVFTGGSGGFVQLDAATGKTVASFDAPPQPGYSGTISPPLLLPGAGATGTVFFTTANALLAVDAATSQLLWNQSFPVDDQGSFGAPTLVSDDAAGATLILANSARSGLYGMLASGEQRWANTDSGFIDKRSQLAVEGDVVAVEGPASTGGGQRTVRGLNVETGTVMWTMPTIYDDEQALVLASSVNQFYVYTKTARTLTVLNASTGSVVFYVDDLSPRPSDTMFFAGMAVLQDGSVAVGTTKFSLVYGDKLPAPAPCVENGGTADLSFLGRNGTMYSVAGQPRFSLWINLCAPLNYDSGAPIATSVYDASTAVTYGFQPTMKITRQGGSVLGAGDSFTFSFSSGATSAMVIITCDPNFPSLPPEQLDAIDLSRMGNGGSITVGHKCSGVCGL